MLIDLSCSLWARAEYSRPPYYPLQSSGQRPDEPALRTTVGLVIAPTTTRSTGGAHFSFNRQKAVEEAVINIGEELHGQYLLSFTPRALAASGFHPIHVMSRDRPDLQIRSRAGYWTAPPE